MHGETFGPYRLLGPLGRGGMGEVFRAWDTGHERVVALKLLAPHLAADDGYRARFQREARLSARLRGPHVVPIHRYGEIDGRLFLDMRLVEGEDLASRLARWGPLPVPTALSVVAQVAEALDAAHADGLVHRDVKPSNVLLTGAPADPFVYLVDFGIARSSRDGGGITQTGTAIGSYEYMAPERFVTGQDVDPRVDVYALACVLYECLTGTRAFPSTGLPAAYHAHLHTEPPPLWARRSDVPPALDGVLRRALARDPARRTPTAGGFAAEARQAVSAPAAGPAAASASQPVPRPVPRPTTSGPVPTSWSVPVATPAAGAPVSEPETRQVAPPTPTPVPAPAFRSATPLLQPAPRMPAAPSPAPASPSPAPASAPAAPARAPLSPAAPSPAPVAGRPGPSSAGPAQPPSRPAPWAALLARRARGGRADPAPQHAPAPQYAGPPGYAAAPRSATAPPRYAAAPRSATAPPRYAAPPPYRPPGPAAGPPAGPAPARAPSRVRPVLAALLAGLFVALVAAVDRADGQYPLGIAVGFGLTALAGEVLLGLTLGVRDALDRAGGLLWVLGAVAVGTLVLAEQGAGSSLAGPAAFAVAQGADLVVWRLVRPGLGWRAALAASNLVGAVAYTTVQVAAGATGEMGGVFLATAVTTALTWAAAEVLRPVVPRRWRRR
ncbi:protein kinase domain-containing protein [Blastococcus sp. SYSU D00695]